VRRLIALRRCASQIDRDGELIPTRSGLKEHPGLKGELANRAFVSRTLQRLGLDVEPVRPDVGRPGGCCACVGAASVLTMRAALMAAKRIGNMVVLPDLVWCSASWSALSANVSRSHAKCNSHRRWSLDQTHFAGSPREKSVDRLPSGAANARRAQCG
jgi:hypothetical protein